MWIIVDAAIFTLKYQPLVNTMGGIEFLMSTNITLSDCRITHANGCIELFTLKHGGRDKLAGIFQRISSFFSADNDHNLMQITHKYVPKCSIEFTRPPWVNWQISSLFGTKGIMWTNIFRYIYKHNQLDLQDHTCIIYQWTRNWFYYDLKKKNSLL